MSDNNIERSAEALSALMDGEVSELELRRTLREIESSEELAQTWHRYQVASTVLKRQSDGYSGNWQQLSLQARVSAALAQEAPLTPVAENTVKAWFKPVAGIAVAASVSVMVIMGWQGVVAPQPGAPVAAQASSSQIVSPLAAGSAQPLMRVSQGVTASVAAPAQQVIRINPDAQRRINDYMLSHSGNAALSTAAGLAPYARSVPSSTEVQLVPVKMER